MFKKTLSSSRHWLASIAAALGIGVLNAQAQQLVLHVTSSHSSVQVSNIVTFSIGITNETVSPIGNVVLTFTTGPNAEVVSAPSPPVNSTTATVNVGTIQAFGFLNFTNFVITARPLSGGPFTNIFALSSDLGPSPPTNIVVQATNAAAVETDLAIGVSPPVLGIVAGDFTAFTVTVTNLGPATAPNVVVSNLVPAGAGILGISPANQFTQANGVVNLGDLTNQAVRTFQLRISPTNAGDLTFTSAVFSSGVEDTNPTNNTASATVEVAAFVTGQLVATNLTAMVGNPQTGLLEQTIQLSNIGTTAVESAHVIVANLTNRLYNAAGTNNGNPFVAYTAPLEPGQSVNLVLEYYVPTRKVFTVPNSNYIAVAASTPNIQITNAPGVEITRFFTITNGAMLIEFSSIPGRSYTVYYSSNMLFDPGFIAQPPVIAPTTRTQWIDDGPPKTLRHPSEDPMRFYRVHLNP